MKIKNISMTIEKTIQLQQFEPFKSIISMSAEISENDDLDKCFDEIRQILLDESDINVSEALKD